MSDDQYGPYANAVKMFKVMYADGDNKGRAPFGLEKVNGHQYWGADDISLIRLIAPKDARLLQTMFEFAWQEERAPEPKTTHAQNALNAIKPSICNNWKAFQTIFDEGVHMYDVKRTGANADALARIRDTYSEKSRPERELVGLKCNNYYNWTKNDIIALYENKSASGGIGTHTFLRLKLLIEAAREEAANKILPKDAHAQNALQILVLENKKLAATATSGKEWEAFDTMFSEAFIEIDKLQKFGPYSGFVKQIQTNHSDTRDAWKASDLVSLYSEEKTRIRYTNIQQLFELAWREQNTNVPPEKAYAQNALTAIMPSSCKNWKDFQNIQKEAQTIIDTRACGPEYGKILTTIRTTYSEENSKARAAVGLECDNYYQWGPEDIMALYKHAPQKNDIKGVVTYNSLVTLIKAARDTTEASPAKENAALARNALNLLVAENTNLPKEAKSAIAAITSASLDAAEKAVKSANESVEKAYKIVTSPEGAAAKAEAIKINEAYKQAAEEAFKKATKDYEIAKKATYSRDWESFDRIVSAAIIRIKEEQNNQGAAQGTTTPNKTDAATTPSTKSVPSNASGKPTEKTDKAPTPVKPPRREGDLGAIHSIPSITSGLASITTDAPILDMQATLNAIASRETKITVADADQGQKKPLETLVTDAVKGINKSVTRAA